ncbi:ankyrin repeat domain-containing protein 39-like [Actinia tenebrosa]|uniref:Ankyrin repeat domain-containing protein 39-like n=1 Tax=Actinia tenebrosa TaxID=6105 RepID=A0A6P8HGD7_ACTTE|nr:ankyrin repeat domain-containing protein 39-like [Actinia tenebrosa]
MEEHIGGCCKCHSSSSYGQNMSEMDFARGVWTAAMDGEFEKVEDYLNKGGDPNAVDSSGYTALHYASRSGHFAVCELLLMKGACANAQTRSGQVTPLHRAAYCGRIGVVNLLLRHQADPTLCDTDGQTALHKASEKGHKEIVQLLVDRNPGLQQIKDNRGRTALDIIPQG